MEFLLNGEIPTKKNHYKIRRDKWGNPVMYQSKQVKKWEYDNFFLLKSLYKGAKILEPIKLVATFYIHRDKDLDNMLNTLQDLLQKVVIENDSQVFEIEAKKERVLENQRVYFKIIKL
jgi:Holliday junction resolvase RusA-like endonuclease